MNWYSSLVTCLLMVAVVFLNVACSKKPKEEVPVVTVASEDGIPEMRSYFYCSHKVGSVVKPGESISYTLKKTNLSLNFKTTVKATGFDFEGGVLTIYRENSYTTSIGSFLVTSDIYKHCWGEENCFIAERNSGGGWTIKSLPFNK